MELEHIRSVSENKEKTLDDVQRRQQNELSELPEAFDDPDVGDNLPEEFGERGEKPDYSQKGRLEGHIEGQNGEVGYTPNWAIIETEHSPLDDLRDTNPNYAGGREWQKNCQRCAPAYEMRRRGFDVTAQPAPSEVPGAPEEAYHLAYHPFDAWEDPDVKQCKGSGISEIQDTMKKWGDGARAQVVVYWEKWGGHTFIAEQADGKTHFIDPQTGKEGAEVEKYFDHVAEDRTQFCRIDDREASTYILDCCKEREI